MKIIHISDLHIGEKKESPEVLDKLIQEVNESRPETIIITGDLTDEGLEREYKDVVEILKRFEKKPYVVPGNHDARNDGLEIFREHFTKPPFADYIKNLNAVLIGLNSSLPDSQEGMIGEQQLEWLTRQLEDIPKWQVPGKKILFMHHHILPIPHTGRERNILYDAGELLELAKNNGIDMILSGHKHQHYVWQLNNIIISNAGTAFANKLLLRNKHSYNIVTIGENHITIELKEIGFPAKPLFHYEKNA